MPPMPNGKFETKGSLIAVGLILPSIVAGLILLFFVIIVIIKCRLCCPTCRHRNEDEPKPSAMTSVKSAHVGSGRGKEETAKTRNRSTDSTCGLLRNYFSTGLEATSDEVDEGPEEVDEKKRGKASIGAMQVY